MVIILRPGTDFLQWAALLPLLASLCYACYQVSTRLLSFSEHPLTLFFYTSVVGLAVTTPMALVVWSPMTGIEWLILLFVGFFGFAGQFLLIKAFQLAEASTVAPFIYVQLLFAGFFGWRLFGDLPDVWVLLGAAVVICSGLYICGARPGVPVRIERPIPVGDVPKPPCPSPPGAPIRRL